MTLDPESGENWFIINLNQKIGHMGIKLYGALRPIVGQNTIEVDLQPNANAQDLLDALVAKYPSM
ncbi:MAG TPA: hypothetical protein DIT94_02610 [Deltaproteobacteria bacterium]|nr:hypothetical protein [Deltaproteobacteria bacterium]MBI13194.1 hypothetical protein [Deltaproteobacteria bacterium]HCP33247.1 hypothetical protein [Deltaproteobacteria bacterium]